MPKIKLNLPFMAKSNQLESFTKNSTYYAGIDDIFKSVFFVKCYF